MATPDQDLPWTCPTCGAEWDSRAARDTCIAIDADDDRDARRR